MKKIKIVLLFLFTVLIIITLIYMFDFGLDSGLLTEQPCKAPCWKNLIPGQTTEDEINRFLISLESRDWVIGNERNTSFGCRIINLKYKPDSMKSATFELAIENGRLVMITSLPRNVHPIGIISLWFGQPESIESILGVGPESNSYLPMVFYPKQGMAFVLNGDDHNPGFIHPFMMMSVIYYYQPGTVSNYYLAEYSCEMGQEEASQFSQKQISRFVRPWTNYGKVEVFTSK